MLFSKQQPITGSNSQAGATHGSPSNRCSAKSQAHYANSNAEESVNPEVVQQSQVKKNQLPTVIIKVPKPRSESGQKSMEKNDGSKAICEVTTAAWSERKLPGNLETKPKAEIRQLLVTSSLDPIQPSEIAVNDPPPSQEKHDLSEIVPFPNAARRTKTRITADADVIVNLHTDDNVERPSDPDPMQSQQSTSGGSESTVVNNDSSPESAPDPHQSASGTPPLAAEQCHIANVTTGFPL